MEKITSTTHSREYRRIIYETDKTQQMSVSEETNKLRFRRQFLLSPNTCAQLENWNHNQFGTYNLYTHPDLETTFLKEDNADIALLGFIINPERPEQSNADILKEIYTNVSVKTITEKLYHYSGRFVLLVKLSDEHFAFHDPCGLRMVHYTRFEDKVFLASQPLLLELAVPLRKGEKYQQYQQSNYKKSDIEHWIPSGLSLYHDVYQLIPNHYLSFSDVKQIRYWPYRSQQEFTLEEAVMRSAALLKKIMIACNTRFKLALPITGGFDSRTILSACKEIAEDIFFYTLQYRDLKPDSHDIKIPRKLLTRLGYTHNILDCRKPPDENFSEIYRKNSDMSHMDDWGKIAAGMLRIYPSERVVIKGSCSEVARGGFILSAKPLKITSHRQLIKYIPGWEQIEFINDEVLRWYSAIKDPAKNFGYNIQELFYWEHRMGSWQAQNQLEWDIIQETVTPFNNRELLDIALAVNYEYRQHPDYIVYREIMRSLWEDVLSEPVNPRPFYHKINVLYNVIREQIKLKWQVTLPFLELFSESLSPFTLLAK